ncbi:MULTISPECIES: dTMP kinase [Rhizobium/Agrobacterium group]|uniref:dTMP kinase n=1 Tax=Rhizobium/Agrobacterium group TaxID=227290 RepID=UPI0023004538|nr:MULTISPECIES: dTMP kinase [Rhizobium/Agrobacterium group]MDA5631489.1 dTMP kinase [Agrobacterium sp. ST15.16.024]MDF1887350.1 dTMP kinase [Rhizobium rhizogenes]
MPFISIEGIDGSGKSEQTRILTDRLIAVGKEVIRTKEPDGGHLGSEVRAMMVVPNRTLSPVEQMLLVNASRYGHVRTVIRPALAAGAWVISDRFIDSTFAFQVHGQEDGLGKMFEAIRDVVVGGTMPDLTIVLDLPSDAALERRSKRQGDIDDPAEVSRNFGEIRRGLLVAAARAPSRCKVVDADAPLADVADRVWQAVATAFRLE